LGRKERYRPTHGKEGYLNKDNTRLKVIMWLRAVGKSNQNNMMTNEQSPFKRGQKWITLSNILNELHEWRWIEKKPSDEAKNVFVYKLLDKGKEIAELIENLQREDSVFRNLDCFDGVKLDD